MRSILVTGGEGQVGQALRQCVALPEFELLFPKRDIFDLADLSSMASYFYQHVIDAVINLAAYTAVDKAEDDAENAFRINRDAASALAQMTACLDIPLVHISTDYVFSGELDRAYHEDDPTEPLGIYGLSKEAGEQAIRLYNPNHAIIRTSWVVSPYRQNFVKTMLRLARDRDAINVVDDQIGAPTSATDLALATLRVTQELVSGNPSARGTFHFSNFGEASWADVADEVMRLSGSRGGPHALINRITTEDYPTRAKRPRNSHFNTLKFEHIFGYRPRPWQNAVGDIVAELVKGVKS